MQIFFMGINKYFSSLGVITLLMMKCHVLYGQVPATPNATFSIIASCENTSVTWHNDPPDDVTWRWSTSADGTRSDNIEGGGDRGETVYVRGQSTNLYLQARSKKWPYALSATQFVGYIEVNPRPCAYVELVGATTVQLGENAEYKAVFSDANHKPIPAPTVGFGGYWSTIPENAGAGSSDYTSFTINWTKVGTFKLYYELTTDQDPYFFSVGLAVILEVTVLDPALPTPNTTFSIAKNCANTLVTRSSNPPTNVEWYWQASPTGTDLSLGYSSSITRNSTGNLYLRARLKSTPNTWSHFLQFVGNVEVSAKGCPPLPPAQYVAPAPTSSRNYVAIQTPRVSGLKDESQLNNNSQYRNSVQTSIQYLDGMGRKRQTVHHQASPLGYDLIQPIALDALGREQTKYLPYISNSGAHGSYRPNALRPGTGSDYNESDQYKFYTRSLDDDKIAPSITPFALSVFEPSPLNRVSKQGAPGEDWQPDHKDISQSTDHTKKMIYNLNQENEVFQFSYDQSTGSLSVKENGTYKYYGANQLYANKTIDEHQIETIEYVDKNGRMVLKKVQSGVDSNGVKQYPTTYFIYDDLGNLLIVLPPEAVVAIMQSGM